MKKSTSLGESERNTYSEYAREFRRALLSHKNNGNSHDRAKEFLRSVFEELDTNCDGDVSTDELKTFIRSVLSEYEISSEFGTNSDKFADVLVSQIDINHDGTVSYHEMDEFLWPKVESDREVGVILDLMRENFENCIQDKVVRRALKESSDTNDRVLIDAFAKHIKMGVLRGNLIEVRALKKAFHKLNGLGVGELSDYEVDILIESLDTNRDGVVSPREFRAWMFVPSSRMTGATPSSPTTAADPAPASASSSAPAASAPGGESSDRSIHAPPATSNSPASTATEPAAIPPPAPAPAPAVAPAPAPVPVPVAASSVPKSQSAPLSSTDSSPQTNSSSSSSGSGSGAKSTVVAAPRVAASASFVSTSTVSSSSIPAPSGSSRAFPKAVQVVEVVEGDEGGGGEGFFQAAAGESSGSGSGSGSGQARRRGKQSADEGAGSRQRSYLEVQGDFLGGAGYDCKERFSPGVDEATHLLLGEEGEERRATKTDDTEDCCKKNWGYLVIAAVFVMAFYAISNRDE
jgi:Ca2+-binding EF-hand superfamily protein